MSDFTAGRPKQLGQLIQSLVRRKGLTEESAGRELDDIWKKVAGQRIAANSYVRRLRAGVLEVSVSNGVILEELTCYLQHELLPKIQQSHPSPPVNSLKFIKVN